MEVIITESRQNEESFFKYKNKILVLDDTVLIYFPVSIWPQIVKTEFQWNIYFPHILSWKRGKIEIIKDVKYGKINP